MPAAASVELTDELQQPRAGGVEMSGELGDLVAEPVQLSNRFRRGPNGALKVVLHRRSPRCPAPTLYRDFRRPTAPPEWATAARQARFFVRRLPVRASGQRRPSGATLAI